VNGLFFPYPPPPHCTLVFFSFSFFFFLWFNPWTRPPLLFKPHLPLPTFCPFFLVRSLCEISPFWPSPSDYVYFIVLLWGSPPSDSFDPLFYVVPHRPPLLLSLSLLANSPGWSSPSLVTTAAKGGSRLLSSFSFLLTSNYSSHRGHHFLVIPTLPHFS